jgi:hypothetical protein
MPNLAAYFHHAGWPAEEIEPGVWRSAFADDIGAAYTLYVLAADDWLHFAVSPLLPGAQLPPHLLAALLRSNQGLRLARLALDDDGDVNLLADLPAAHTDAALFAQTLALLAYYTDRLAAELRGEPLPGRDHDDSV